MNDISPAKILQDVARSIPSEFHKLIVVVGSLAAGFWQWHVWAMKNWTVGRKFGLTH